MLAAAAILSRAACVSRSRRRSVLLSSQSHTEWGGDSHGLTVNRPLLDSTPNGVTLTPDCRSSEEGRRRTVGRHLGCQHQHRTRVEVRAFLERRQPAAGTSHAARTVGPSPAPPVQSIRETESRKPVHRSAASLFDYRIPSPPRRRQFAASNPPARSRTSGHGCRSRPNLQGPHRRR